MHITASIRGNRFDNMRTGLVMMIEASSVLALERKDF